MPIRRGGIRERALRPVTVQPHEIQPASPLTTLAGQDVVYGAPGQVPDYDWTLYGGVSARAVALRSRQAARAAQAYEEIQPATPNLTLLAQDRIYGAPGQAPTYDFPLPVQQRRAFPVEDRTLVENLQQSTLFAAPGAPILPLDWPLPRGRPFPVADRTWTAVPVPTLVGQDSVYGGPGQVPAYDWTMRGVPVGWSILPKRQSQVARGAQPHDVQGARSLWTLAGLDTLLRGPGQVLVYDWPVPRGRRPPIQPQIEGSKLAIPYLVVVVVVETGTWALCRVSVAPQSRLVVSARGQASVSASVLRQALVSSDARGQATARVSVLRNTQTAP